MFRSSDAWYVHVGVCDEIDEAAADAPHGWNLELAGPYGLRKAADLQPPGTFQCRERIRHAHADRAHGCAMDRVVGMRKAFRLAVDDEVDVALSPAGHCLASMPRGRRESQRLQHVPELGRFLLVGAELDELDPLAVDAAVRVLQNPLQQVRKRTHAVDRDVRRRPGEEPIVEDLERQHAPIADVP